MKRLAAAGTFALLAGGVTLILVASILYSCRGGGHPHDMGNEHETEGSTHSSSALPSTPHLVVNEAPSPPGTAHRIDVDASSGDSL